MRALDVTVRTPASAIALGKALLVRAREEQVPWIAASVLEGRAVVLGAAQRAGRVVNMEGCARQDIHVLRRATTGTAAYAGGRAILWTLALPQLTSLWPDTSPRTLLNRNIRGFLRGFTRAGAAAHYFGREWISIRQRPAAIIGFDMDLAGAVLIEVYAGFDQPVALPELLATPDERSVDRWRGKTPQSLSELLPQRSPEQIARAVIEAIAGTADALLEPGSIARHALESVAPVTSASDPVPEGLVLSEPERVPIGWLEAAVGLPAGDKPPRAWLGGDVLAPVHVLAEVARAVIAGDAEALAALSHAPIDGANFSDLTGAVKRAAGAISDRGFPRCPR
jgi:lipoate-protein ligase A